MENTEAIKPEVAAKLSSTGKKFFKLIEFDDKEQMICEIRKHPIGLFFIYLSGIFVVLVMAVLFGIFGFAEGADSLFEGTGLSGSSVQSVIIFLGFIIIIGVLAVMTIQAILYVNNVIFLTSDKIAQILYRSLFNRKISQLNIGDVQDVTVTQNGVLAHMFNYGTLVVETAGEQQNYTFTYIPHPYESSKLIIGAHERYLEQFGSHTTR